MVVCCDVAGCGVVRAGPEAVAALRQDPGAVPGGPLPPSLLRHADEQTVVALAAVLRAVAEHNLTGTRFPDWGVLAAPRFLGRVASAVALHQFRTEGAWGVSPHLIPQRSLHAVSGTISQALKLHGPNFGVGGGPGGVTEALLAAAALLADGDLPGAWVVATGWDPEPEPDLEGRPQRLGVCTGVALALIPPRDDPHGLRLHVDPARQPPGLTLEALAAAVTGAEPSGAGWLHLERFSRGAAGGEP
jgi:hypothetical protein